MNCAYGKSSKCVWGEWAWSYHCKCSLKGETVSTVRPDNSTRWDIHHKITSYFKNDFSILRPNNIQPSNQEAMDHLQPSQSAVCEDEPCLRSISDTFSKASLFQASAIHTTSPGSCNAVAFTRRFTVTLKPPLPLKTIMLRRQMFLESMPSFPD